MFFDVFPYLHGVVMITVKGSVHKFYLLHSIVQKKLQFLLYGCNISEPYTLLNGGQAIAAAKRTATAGFVINDSVLKGGKVIVKKGHTAHVSRLAEGRKSGSQTQTRNLPKGFPVPATEINLHDPPEGDFPLPYHDTGKLWICFHSFVRIKGDLRTSQPQVCSGQNLGQLHKQLPNQLPVPDIAGEPDGIRLFCIDIRQYVLHVLIDGILRQFHVLRRLFSGRSPQTVYGRIGMYIFCIDCHKQKFHRPKRSSSFCQHSSGISEIQRTFSIPSRRDRLRPPPHKSPRYSRFFPCKQHRPSQ